MIDPLADDDSTLRALGRRAREPLEARPGAWEAVARGERSEDEVAAERLAAGDAPEAVALARALFRPPSAAEHDALVDALLAGRAIPREPEAAVVAPFIERVTESANPRASETAANQRASEPSEPAANDSGRAWWVAALAVAAVVALGWWLVPDRSGSPVDPAPPLLALAPLPAYALTHDGGLTSTRGEPVAPAAVLRYRKGSRIEWIVRPEVAVQGEVDARLFAFGGREALLLAPRELVEVGASGAVRIAGPVDALGLAPGVWTIAIVVGRPSALPGDPAAVRDAGDSEAFVVRRVELVLED